MTTEDAVLLLQRHERARQGRLRAKLMEDIRRQEAAAAEKPKGAEEKVTMAMAANKIQRIWKGALARRQVRKLREEELVFIGMVGAGFTCKPSTYNIDCMTIYVRLFRFPRTSIPAITRTAWPRLSLTAAPSRPSSKRTTSGLSSTSKKR